MTPHIFTFRNRITDPDGLIECEMQLFYTIHLMNNAVYPSNPLKLRPDEIKPYSGYDGFTMTAK